MRQLLSLAAALVTGVAVAADPPAELTKVVFGSCANQDKPLPILGAILNERPDLFVTLGDTIYNDLDRSVEVTPGVIQDKYNTLAGLPGWQKLKAQCRVRGTWDDHDYGVNDSGAEWPHKAESQRIFHDFFGTPKDSPLREQQGVYSSETYGPEGKRVQVILLDTRYFRSPLKTGSPLLIPPYGMIRQPYVPQTDPEATLLGQTQWDWLREQLKKPAEVRLIGSSIQLVSQDHPFEKWMNIPAERQRFFDLVRETNANGVIVLSGDRHLGELSMMPDAVGYPLYDLTSSGLNQASKTWRAVEINRHRVATMPFGDHYGVVSFKWDGDPSVTLQLKDAAGTPTLTHTVPLSVLSPKPGSAPAAATVPLPEGMVSPAEATKKVGEPVKLQMVVKSGRLVSGGKRLLLNSEENYRTPGNLVVVLKSGALTGKYAAAQVNKFLNQTIRVTGTVSEFNGSPQIELDAPASVEIVEEQ